MSPEGTNKLYHRMVIAFNIAIREEEKMSSSL
jgi:hypothetical protein